MKISVIIPTYNGERTIRRAIESVLNQTIKVETEILICDDGSTDDTIKIAKEYHCIILQNDRNSGGPNKGRNRGIKAATGDLVAFLDQDDEWVSGKLEKQIAEIENGADLVYSSYIKKTK
jgi:glycosyltransferase involved in cell wall biosynthesis